MLIHPSQDRKEYSLCLKDMSILLKVYLDGAGHKLNNRLGVWEKDCSLRPISHSHPIVLYSRNLAFFIRSITLFPCCLCQEAHWIPSISPARQYFILYLGIGMQMQIKNDTKGWQLQLAIYIVLTRGQWPYRPAATWTPMSSDTPLTF